MTNQESRITTVSVTPEVRDRLRSFKRGQESYAELLERIADTFEPDDTPTLTVYDRDEPTPACPVRGCEFETYDEGRMHDHVSDAHQELLDSIMTGEVVVHE